MIPLNEWEYSCKPLGWCWLLKEHIFVLLTGNWCTELMYCLIKKTLEVFLTPNLNVWFSVEVPKSGWSVSTSTFSGAPNTYYGPQNLIDNKIGTHNAYASGNQNPFNWIQVDFGTVISVRKQSGQNTTWYNCSPGTPLPTTDVYQSIRIGAWSRRRGRYYGVGFSSPPVIHLGFAETWDWTHALPSEEASSMQCL